MQFTQTNLNNGAVHNRIQTATTLAPDPEWVRRFAEALPAESREVLWLVVGMDGSEAQSARQISETLGIGVPTANKRIALAFHRLRAAIPTDATDDELTELLVVAEIRSRARVAEKASPTGP